MNVRTYLKQSFPKAESKARIIFSISLFVVLFLTVFQPFGIGQIEEGFRKYLFLSGFGLVSLVILCIELILIESLFPVFFSEKNWTILKELFWLFCIVFSIGLGNVLYMAILFGPQWELTLSYVINFQIITFAVSIFPISIFTFTKHNYLLRKHTASASLVNGNLFRETARQQNLTISIYSYNESKKVEFEVNNLVFIESKGNDIEIHIIEDDLLTCKKLRNTVKKTLESLSDSPEIVQCHRAYIVNLNQVVSVQGNSQGLLLRLANCDVEVPVSRRFVAAIKSQLA